LAFCVGGEKVECGRRVWLGKLNMVRKETEQRGA
jgi:hypothetical protein